MHARIGSPNSDPLFSLSSSVAALALRRMSSALTLAKMREMLVRSEGFSRMARATCTHAHTVTHSCTQLHTVTHSYMRACAHAHTHTRARARAHTQLHHTHGYPHMHACIIARHCIAAHGPCCSDFWEKEPLHPVQADTGRLTPHASCTRTCVMQVMPPPGANTRAHAQSCSCDFT